MKNLKALGADEITTKIIKARDEKMVDISV